MLFLKSLLKEKDARIACLENEVGFLRSLIQPKQPATNRDANYEANAVLNGQTEQFPGEAELSDSEIAVIQERDRLLSGLY